MVYFQCGARARSNGKWRRSALYGCKSASLVKDPRDSSPDGWRFPSAGATIGCVDSLFAMAVSIAHGVPINFLLGDRV
jgi:hypothetical protein